MTETCSVYNYKYMHVYRIKENAERLSKNFHFYITSRTCRIYIPVAIRDDQFNPVKLS